MNFAGIFDAAFITVATAYAATVLGVLQILKNLVKISGVAAVVASIVLSFILTVTTIGANGVPYWVVLSLLVAAISNGVFKVVKNAGAKPK